ncbi:MAG: anti-sigma factor [Actinomycetota bacterium]|nr:anti-sigma factor [Actinomycetota bacterium]
MNAEPPSGGNAPDEGFAALLAARLDAYAERTPTDGTQAPPDGEEAADTPDGQEDAAEAMFLAVGEQLRAEATWSGPPPGLRDSILAAARTRTAPVEAEAPEADEAVEPERVAPAPARRPWWHPERWFPQVPRMAWAVPTAIVAAAVFTVGVLAVDRSLRPGLPPGEEFVAVGTTLAPQSTASGSIVAEPGGFSITLQPEKLPAAAPGSYYAAWLTGPAGKVPIGSFHWRLTGAPIELWSGVDPAAYPRLTVTLQAEGEPPSPSTLVVLTADLAS